MCVHARVCVYVCVLGRGVPRSPQRECCKGKPSLPRTLKALSARLDTCFSSAREACGPAPGPLYCFYTPYASAAKMGHPLYALSASEALSPPCLSLGGTGGRLGVFEGAPERCGCGEPGWRLGPHPHPLCPLRLPLQDSRVTLDSGHGDTGSSLWWFPGTLDNSPETSSFPTPGLEPPGDKGPSWLVLSRGQDLALEDSARAVREAGSPPSPPRLSGPACWALRSRPGGPS